jgi:hypothetical protein
MLRISGNGLQGFRRGAEQQTVHLAFVLHRQHGQLFGQSKDDVEILARQKFGLTFFQPLGPGERLALGTMPIAAGIISVAFVSALVTLLQVPPQGGGAASFDGTEHTLLPNGQRCAMGLAKLVTMGAHDIGDFQCLPSRQDGAYNR